MERELKEINAQINECYAMVDHFIDLKKRGVSYAADEVKYWRKMLQNAKLYKRSLRMSQTYCDSELRTVKVPKHLGALA